LLEKLLGVDREFFLIKLIFCCLREEKIKEKEKEKPDRFLYGKTFK
jgi:hypothetical protein